MIRNNNMKFELPVASRQRLDELLEYLGDRAEDFKKCFDIESEWCWKYADLVLRGTVSRELEYGERHHIIPVTFYRSNGYAGCRWAKIITHQNLTVLTFGEHVYCHYLAAHCVKSTYKGGCASAFWKLYTCNSKSVNRLPEDFEIIANINNLDAIRVRSMIAAVSNVDKRGGTHSWQDIKQQKREWAQLNAERLKQQRHDNYMANREERLLQSKIYHANNPEVHLRASRKYSETHRDEINEKSNEAYHANKEHRKEIQHRSNEKHKETRKEHAKQYRAAHRAERSAYNKQYEQEHKEARVAYRKQWAKNNPDKVKDKSSRYKAKQKAKGLMWRMNPATGKREWMPTNGKIFIIKPVGKFAKDGVTMLTSYANIKEAAIDNNIPHRTLSGWVNGQHKGKSEFVFKFLY